MQVRVLTGQIWLGRVRYRAGDVMTIDPADPSVSHVLWCIEAGRACKAGDEPVSVEPIAEPVDEEPAPVVDWSRATVRELRDELDRRGVTYTTRDRKSELYAALRAAGGE